MLGAFAAFIAGLLVDVVDARLLQQFQHPPLSVESSRFNLLFFLAIVSGSSVGSAIVAAAVSSI